MNCALKAFLFAFVLTGIQSLKIPGAKQVSKIGGKVPIVNRVVFGKQRTVPVKAPKSKENQGIVYSPNPYDSLYSQQGQTPHLTVQYQGFQ